jgi:hypothetical protein
VPPTSATVPPRACGTSSFRSAAVRQLSSCSKDGNPRYTEGACPICGWKPEGAPSAPAWLALSRKVEWDLIGLFVLFIVLTFCAVIVAHAAHLRIPLVGR